MTPHRVLRCSATRRGEDSRNRRARSSCGSTEGRPEASASVYPWQGDLYSRFRLAVAADAKLRKALARADRVVWSPRTPGVEFKEIPGAPAPADTPAARLRQMKALGDRFKVTMTGWKADKSDREVTADCSHRAASLPLRSSARRLGGRTSDCIDGEVLAFVSGTDPEAILLLEAVRQGGRPRWQYAFARATAAGLEARLDQTVVWAVDFLEGQVDGPRPPQMTLSHPLGNTASSAGRPPGAADRIATSGGFLRTRQRTAFPVFPEDARNVIPSTVLQRKTFRGSVSVMTTTHRHQLTRFQPRRSPGGSRNRECSQSRSSKILAKRSISGRLTASN